MYPQMETQGVHVPPNRNMSGHADVFPLTASYEKGLCQS